MVATLSQWQNLKHTIEDPSIATAEYEGRKIGIQLFDQAQEMEALAILPKIVKWLDKIIADTYHNFTMPSAKDREESGSVYSWSHTQRLDYNFFTGMRSEIVGMVKDSKRARQPVPENCRGGFEHLVVSSDVQKSVPAPASAPAHQTQRLVDGQEKTIPPVFGGLGIQRPCNQTPATVGARIAGLEDRQREEHRQSLAHVPHNQRLATTTGVITPITDAGLNLVRIGQMQGTQNIGMGTSFQPVKDNTSGEIQVQNPRQNTPGAVPEPVTRALNPLLHNVDWVKALHHAVEKDHAKASDRSSPYPNQHFLEHCPFAPSPSEQQKDSSTTHGEGDKWMEEFVDLTGAAPPTGEEKKTNVSPEKILLSLGELPKVPRSNSVVPERRGSDTTAQTDIADGIFSDAGSAGGSTSPEEDMMDEIDMIRTDDVVANIRSTRLWGKDLADVVTKHGYKQD
jgi:hypothetical protein